MKIKIIPERFIPDIRTIDTDNFILISITSKRDYVFNFRPKNNFIDFLELEFDDVDYGTIKELKNINPKLLKKLHLFTDEQAKQIVNFVLKHKNSIDKIIVHCEAGISRSAGVAKALAVWLNGTDIGIIDPNRHSPNMYAYVKIKQAINEYGNSEESLKNVWDKLPS